MTTWEDAQADIPRHDREYAASQLTFREREIATLAASGLTNARIARRVSLTVSTVEQYLTRVYRKLGCHRDGLATALSAPLGLDTKETPNA